jgi:Brp/Blh family beta-carotene 15,15'-monooxygenase
MTIQIKKINFKHSFIFFLFCNIVSLPFIKAYNLSISPLICLLLILIIGVSHGSLDHIKGRKLLKIFQINNIITFYTTYFLLAVTIIIFWILLPTVVLIAFLIVASFHFGKEDTQFLIDNNSYLNQFLFFLKGSLVILAPLYFNFNETVSIFKLLLIQNETFYQSLNVIENNNFLIIGIVFSALSSIILFFKKFELKKFTIFFDYFSIIIINMHFSPLIAFTIYFCFLHSIRHSISLITELDQESLKNGLLVFIKKATPLTILTGIFCLIGLYFLNNNYNLDSAILKLIFIGLASLTFPHILLEYLIEKNEK